MVGLQNGLKSSLVLARKPLMSAGRYCIRLSRVLTRAVSWARLRLARLARDRFRCDQTGSTGFSSCAYGGSRGTLHPAPAPPTLGIAPPTGPFTLFPTPPVGPRGPLRATPPPTTHPPPPSPF